MTLERRAGYLNIGDMTAREKRLSTRQ